MSKNEIEVETKIKTDQFIQENLHLAETTKTHSFRLTKEQLEERLKTQKPKEIAEDINVAQATVLRWKRAYNL